MTLTRATLGTLAKRKWKDMEIQGQQVRIQKPTPLELSQYQMALVDSKGEPNVHGYAPAVLLLTARMWIDDTHTRLYSDTETAELNTIDADFYEAISDACREYASPEASTVLGESDKTPGFDSPAESASSSG